MNERATIVWFRLDLRLTDNPALDVAVKRGKPIVPAFIWAPEEEGKWPPGAASRWWLHQSLAELDKSLRKTGSRLTIRRGPSLRILRSLLQETGADKIFYNRRYEPALIARDKAVDAALPTESFNSTLLFEPWQIQNGSGKPYRVFTPFWRACVSAHVEVPKIKRQTTLPTSRQFPKSVKLAALALEPKVDWTKTMRATWEPGESGAQRQLKRFLGEAIDGYNVSRDRPDQVGTSRLSPHLHFGEIGPRQVWQLLENHASPSAAGYLRQLGWREFAHHLLFHFPHTADAPLRAEFAKFPWRQDAKQLKAWQSGRAGFPIVDAGMRELWATGWMHNRVRMIVASFLVKDLLIPWQDGARWFWDTLVDADLANNTLGWQWVAGCGADAAPFFRIFNPQNQAAKFDPKGDYVKQWIPELGSMDYPKPLVHHGKARVRALRVLAVLKKIRHST